MAGKECCELTQVLSCLIVISFVSKIINTVSCLHAWAREIKTQGPSSWTVWEDQKLSFHLKEKKNPKLLLASPVISDAKRCLRTRCATDSS